MISYLDTAPLNQSRLICLRWLRKQSQKCQPQSGVCISPAAKHLLPLTHRAYRAARVSRLRALTLVVTLGVSCFFTNSAAWADECSGDTVISTNVNVTQDNDAQLCSFTVTDSGKISGDFAGIENENFGTITTLTNSGKISGNFAGIVNFGTITTLTNSNTISGDFAGIVNFGTITTLTNSNTISGDFLGIYNPGTITTLTNNGTISARSGPALQNFGVIGTLNNAQGSSGSALTYRGNLPTNYNIIIKSPTDYGQLSATSASGSMAFGIYAGGVDGVAASILTATTYTSVLQGLTSPSSITGTSGSYAGGYSYTLVQQGTSGDWDLVVTGGSTDMTTGTTVALSSVGVTANPVLDGGTLTTLDGEASNDAFSVPSTSTITAPTTGSATLSGVFSGSGGLTFNGNGTIIFSGANTYSGDTTVSAGTLSIAGDSATGSGDVFLDSGATLKGSGLISGRLTVAGTLSPGNSPGFLSTNASVTMSTGSTYQQDIAGTIQASNTSPVGAAGYYSFLSITNGQFVIQTGSTLTPRLSNLFTVGQPGYGSATYVPALGDRFRMVTAEGGIAGRFTSLTQPAELAPGTQLLPFYNMMGSNSLELAVIPASYVNTIAAASGNANAQSVGIALTQSAQKSLGNTATDAQEQLLYSISSLTSATNIVSFAQSMAGEVYAAAVAVIAQTTQRTQQSVLARLGDNASLGATGSLTNPTAETKSFANRNVWGDLTYQRGIRSNDSQSGGWNSNLYQLTFGSDFYKADRTTLGAGFALSSVTLNPVYGAATIQQGSLFAYGKMPIKTFMVDAMASIGLSSSDITRGDVTGLSDGFNNKSVMGNDALISLGLSRAIEMESARITPYARVTWQIATQSAVDEGSQASALSVNRYTGNGVRGVIGLAAGSKSNSPLTAKYTYRAYVGVGADSTGLLNPMLNASLAGIDTTITTPNAGATFVQAGLFGTAKLSENSFAYAGISGEARNRQTLGTVNLGLRVQF
jgi:autotransporter-associated beta strand protein